MRVRVEHFDPSANVTLYIVDWSSDVSTPIGTGETDEHGGGVIDGLVPEDARIGETQLNVASDQCITYAYILVIGSAEAMTIDDDTVAPGQVLTVTAGGFQTGSPIGLTIDDYPIQGECWPRECRLIGRGYADAVGTVVMQAGIPHDVSPGWHSLYATGYSPDGFADLTVGVEITVVGATGTLPPTDTE